jgi:uncharacterized RDD family membrane protein YckC
MWYYARGEEQIGPVEEGAFRILVDQRIVGPSTLVWREGMPSWVSYQEIAGTVTDWGTPCSECGRPHLVEELLLFEGKRVCASCKEIFFQRMREGNAAPDAMVLASIGKRFAALIVDSILVGVVSVPIAFAIMAFLSSTPNEPPSEETVTLYMLAMIGALGLWVLFYMTWFVGRFGATPGKMLLGIKIVRSDGSPVSYLRAFARFWAHQLSANIMYIGFIIALFDEQRRGLHDHICDTRVIEKR